MSVPNFLVLNGPNLNTLGEREPHIYGQSTLKDLEDGLHKSAQALKCQIECRQSNSESQLIDWVQAAARENFTGIIINPAAYSHTSLALRDAVAGCRVPVLEVHLTNIHAREEIRRTSMISPAADGVLTGMGAIGYLLAMQALVAGFGVDKRKMNGSGEAQIAADKKN